MGDAEGDSEDHQDFWDKLPSDPASDDPPVSSPDGLTDHAIKIAESGDLERALGIFTKVAELDPRKGSAWVNLAVTQMRLIRLREARESFNRALAIEPGNPMLASNLADLSVCEK